MKRLSNCFKISNSIRLLGLQIDEEALNVLSEVGSKTTLRYAVQLLTPAAISAKMSGRQNVTIVKEDIKDIGDLFLDAKSSAILLKENDKKYMH